ncbi:MAG: ABC transporter transmembrane domain-containing protein, partial [Blastocatellia bacterium]
MNNQNSFASGRDWIVFYFKKYWPRFLLGISFLLVSVTLGIFVPRFTGHAIDYLKTAGADRWGIARYAALIIGTQLVSGVFLFFQRRTLNNVSRHIEYDLRQDFYGHLQNLPLQFFQQQRTGDLMARATNDLSAVRQIVGPAIMYAGQAFFRVLIIVPILFGISAKLTLILLLTMPLVSLTVKYFGHQIHVRFERIQEFFADITARAQENLTGVRVVRAYAREQSEIAAFAELNRQYVDRNLSLVRLSAIFHPLMQFFIGLGFAAILYAGGREAAEGRITIGEFAAFNLYLEQLIWPLISIGYVTNIVQRGAASLKRMHEIMKIEPAIADGETERRRDGETERRRDGETERRRDGETERRRDGETERRRDGEMERRRDGETGSLRGKIEFRNLRFRYSPEAPLVLRDINLTIEPGETIAFIGRTGSG